MKKKRRNREKTKTRREEERGGGAVEKQSDGSVLEEIWSIRDYATRKSAILQLEWATWMEMINELKCLHTHISICTRIKSKKNNGIVVFFLFTCNYLPYTSKCDNSYFFSPRNKRSKLIWIEQERFLFSGYEKEARSYRYVEMMSGANILFPLKSHVQICVMEFSRKMNILSAFFFPQ